MSFDAEKMHCCAFLKKGASLTKSCVFYKKAATLNKQANSGNLYAQLADNIIGKCWGNIKKK